MSTKRVSVAEATRHLAELIELAKHGEEILIESGEDTRVKLVRVPGRREPRVLGLHEGQAQTRDDFNAPLAESFWLGIPASD